ncbi:MAG TPA: hypothetical protein PKX93_09075, partial [bacterium]|nr:hypothetical protein [bacterium]
VASFTNHMPPEPKPGSFRVDLAPGESISWSIPFPYDYYPVRLPCSFRVRLLWQRIESNEVTFQVLASTGTVNKTELLVNSDFSEGETFPCGWRIEHQTIFWNKQEKLLHFLLDVPTATGEGLWVYSLLRPIKTPGSFTLHLKAKSSGPEIIVFVEGWGLVAGRRRRLERNECFAHPATPDWETYRFNVVFSKPEVKLVRIRLFAYGRAGSVWFRKVCLTPAD